MSGAIDPPLMSLPLPEVTELLRLDEHDPRASEAATEVLRRFQPLLRKYWLRHRSGEYEDYVQEAMVRLFIALPKLRDPAAFPGLFRRIVIGTAADASKGVKDMDDIDEISEDELTKHFDESIAAAVVIGAHLEELTPKERAVIQMTFFEELSAGEIARRQGISEGSVRMTKSRAIGRLRTILVKSAPRTRGA